MTFNNTTQPNVFYPVANALASSNPFVFAYENRAPTANDIQYPIQKVWLDTATNNFWELKNFTTSGGILSANWIPIIGATTVSFLEGNDGIPVGPNSSRIIFTLGAANQINVTNTAPNTLTWALTQTVIANNYTNVTHAMSPYTVLGTDYYISVDCSAGTVQLNFPNAPLFKQIWIVKDRTGNAAKNNITLTTPGGTVTFDGLTTYTMNSNYQANWLLANAAPTYEIF